MVDDDPTGSRPGPLLSGLRVLDLSLWQPGHTATQLLADLGADVIKVEPPGGDRMRPLADRFANYNGHKRSVVLDLKDDGDRALFLGLVTSVEVVVENYRPGVADRLGVGFGALREANPAVVVCSISGFGQTGPLAGATGHDANYQAWAGAFTLRDGLEPVPSALLVGDQGSGMAAAFAILAAVLCARRTGEGEHVDVSMADVLASWVAPMGPLGPTHGPGDGPGDGPGPVAASTGEASDTPAATARPGPALGTFLTGDGLWVVLGVFSEDHFWDELCRALGLDGQVGLTMAQRVADTDALHRRVATAVAGWERDRLIELLTARAVPAAPVLSRSEMLRHPHFQARGVLATSPEGRVTIGHPVSYTVHPIRPAGPAPALDEHGDELLGRRRAAPGSRG